MRKYLPTFFWWWPGLGLWSLWYGPRYYWDWCLPTKDHWHIGPLSFYYTAALEQKATEAATQEIAEAERRWAEQERSEQG